MKAIEFILIIASATQGLVFSTQALQPEVLYEFQSSPAFPTNDAGGSAPTSLVLGQDGNLYGTTLWGGSSDNGTVFKLSTDRVFTTLASFTGTREPTATRFNALLLGADGDFYGVAREGGSVFKVSPNGQLTTLTSFTNTNGYEFVSSLVMGNDGALYGTTDVEGYGWLYRGTVFRLTTNGELTTLVAFDGTNGAVPNGLVFGIDGSLYGMTEGNVEDQIERTETVFRMTTDGDLTTLASHTWTNNTRTWPFLRILGRLVLGRDGNFYGTREGYEDSGMVFKVTTNGMLTTLVSFNGTNGADPRAALVLGRDGNFYGTTDHGGSNDLGTVFKMTPDGVLTTLFSFSGTNGAYPDAALVFGNDGNLYGTTSGGGSGGDGTIFRVVLPRLKPLVREPGGGLLLTGTGPAHDSYRLWASTDLSLPFASWTLLSSGSFDNAGNFTFTDAPTNNTRFYRLSVP